MNPYDRPRAQPGPEPFDPVRVAQRVRNLAYAQLALAGMTAMSAISALLPANDEFTTVRW